MNITTYGEFIKRLLYCYHNYDIFIQGGNNQFCTNNLNLEMEPKYLENKKMIKGYCKKH